MQSKRYLQRFAYLHVSVHALPLAPFSAEGKSVLVWAQLTLHDQEFAIAQSTAGAAGGKASKHYGEDGDRRHLRILHDRLHGKTVTADPLDGH
jgi:hypothetical protein